MNDNALMSKIRQLALAKGYTVSDLPDRGTIRAAANMVIGAKSIDAMANFGRVTRPWDACFAIGSIMALFDDSPSMISGAMLVKCISSVSWTPFQFKNWIEMTTTLDSAMIPKIMHNLETYTNKEDESVGPELSNIYTVINIYELIHVLEAFEGIRDGEQPDPIFRNVVQRHIRDRRNYRPSHPVLVSTHWTLLNELRNRNGQTEEYA